MTARLVLPTATGALDGALHAIRDALAAQLVPGSPLRAFSVSLEEDGSGFGAPAWSDAAGDLFVSEDAARAIAARDRNAVEAIAHQLVHAIGSGPAFFDLEEQLLEEAIVEIITQCYAQPICAAFGVEVAEPPLLFRAVDGDLEVARPTAANVSVERFGRIAAWIEGCDDSSEPEDLEDAALAWALRLKHIPAAQRFPALAAAAADRGGDDVDGGAAAFLEEYLRGYLRQLWRSRVGFAGLSYALDRAWLDESERPSERTVDDGEAWRAELEAAERVTLAPRPGRGAIATILNGPPSPTIAAIVRRSLDARLLYWSAGIALLPPTEPE